MFISPGKVRYLDFTVKSAGAYQRAEQEIALNTSLETVTVCLLMKTTLSASETKVFGTVLHSLLNGSVATKDLYIKGIHQT